MEIVKNPKLQFLYHIYRYSDKFVCHHRIIICENLMKNTVF